MDQPGQTDPGNADQTDQGGQDQSQDPLSMLGQILSAMQEGLKDSSPEIQKAVDGIMNAYATLVQVLGGKGGQPTMGQPEQAGGNPNAQALR